MTDLFDRDLGRTAANYAPLTPLGFLDRTSAVHPHRTAVIHGAVRRDWAETAARCRRLGSALAARGIGRGDTVAVMAPNVPAAFEATFGVPMAGAVLCALNTRLDARAIAHMLRHSEARLAIVDRECGAVMRDALALLEAPPPAVEIVDAETAHLPPAAASTYEDLLAEGDPDWRGSRPADEWDAIALNYTSGTTGDPKGVVYHHRGAYLNALGNAVTWAMPHFPVYLWTLPMFHCNGWCFPWTITALAGTHVCLRRVTARGIWDALADHGVTHLCGAPVVMQTILGATNDERRPFSQPVRMMTAAAPPPAAVLERMAAIGIDVTHVYGLTEVYGPAMVCAWNPDWDALPLAEQARLKSRQGVTYTVQEAATVADPETLIPVPADGRTVGEVLMRGNIAMKGYLKDVVATARAFAGGWFHTGDLGVLHADGYIELKDRSKDIVISGGENISTIEVESVLYRHPAVLEAAVVARPDEKWGESPCAFVTLRPGMTATAEEIVAFCRANLAGFKCPRTVVFGELPKTSTGKVQKFVLRERARTL
jgi:fatty-acyl-CoA synthase